MKKLIIFTIFLSILCIKNFAQSNTSPLPDGNTKIGGHLWTGQTNEVWTDASSLYFNFRGNASETHFWNLGGASGKSILSLYNNGQAIFTGNVGIGATPSFDLDIKKATAPVLMLSTSGDVTNQGTTGSVRFVSQRSGYGTNYYTAVEGYQDGGVGDYNGLRFIVSRAGQKEAMYITSNGEVAIYTVASSTTVKRGLTLVNSGAWGNGGGVEIHGSMGNWDLGNIRFIKTGVSAARIDFLGGASDTYGLTVLEGGKVGIGTTIPSSALNIVSPSAQSLRIGYTQNKEILIGATSVGDGQIYAYDGVAYRNILLCMDGNTAGGNVGIGCNPGTSTKLAVNGKINATEVVVTATVPSSDYVFEKDYKLKSLNEVEDFVNTNKHLPEVPSAAEFKEQGCNVGQMQDVLLKKVEELTLYMIEQNKLVQSQTELVKSQSYLIKAQEERIKALENVLNNK